MMRVRIEEPGRAPRSISVARFPTTVGRSDDNDIVLDRAHVSGRHGELFMGTEGPSYMDQGSTNGTSLVRAGTSSRLSVGRQNAVKLQAGDRLLFGDSDKQLAMTVVALDGGPVTAGPPTVVVSQRSATSADLLLENQPADALKVLCRLARQVTEVETEEALFEQLAEACWALFGAASHITVYLGRGREVAPEGRVYAKGTSMPLPGAPPTPLVERVRRAQEALLVADTDPPTPESAPLRAASIRSMLAAPLGAGTEGPEVLQVENRITADRFTESDLEQALLVAAQASVALARLRKQARLESEGQHLAETNRYLQARDRHRLCQGPVLEGILQSLGAVLDSDVSVLVTGETGVGKEVVARYFHDAGPRRAQTFVAVNCAAIPESMLEDELFGHVKGAFTGAMQARKGMFELAHESTLFLDEVGDLPAAMQTKLLRALEVREIWPIGAERPKSVDVRVIAATNKDLRQEVAEGRFRADLFYRLAVYPVHLPPLRERKDDIVVLAEHFLRLFADKTGRTPPRLSDSVVQVLRAAKWPGNARELKNEMERVSLRARGEDEVRPEHLTVVPAVGVPSDGGEPVEGPGVLVIPPSGVAFEELERRIYTEVLKMHGGHQSRAAKALHLKYTTFRFRAKKVGAL